MASWYLAFEHALYNKLAIQKHAAKRPLGTRAATGLQLLPGCLLALSVEWPCAISEGSIPAAKSCAPGAPTILKRAVCSRLIVRIGKELAPQSVAVFCMESSLPVMLR